jgi:hypothetical protein
MKDYTFVLGFWFVIAAFFLGIKSELTKDIESTLYVASSFIIFLLGIFILIISSKIKRE